MHQFDYRIQAQALLTSEVSSCLTALRECNGKQEIFMGAKTDILNGLLHASRLQSIKASNLIDGVFTVSDRAEALTKGRIAPLNENERQIVGYRNAYDKVFSSYAKRTPDPKLIKSLHAEAFGLCRDVAKGVWKTNARPICIQQKTTPVEVDFVPVLPACVDESVKLLAEQYDVEFQRGETSPLILTAMFLVDFFCIYPFAEGNGRVGRLLANMMLLHSGCLVGKYVSVDSVIDKSLDDYYEALRASAVGWHENTNDYMPFLKYFLGVLERSYREFFTRTEHVIAPAINKTERIKEVFNHKIGKVSKSDISTLCPDINISMIERTLNEMVEQGIIEKVGKGRGTGYVLR